ncbi:MAG: hypothetical protein GTO41_06235, partial [Burkholderiales bacterium]|nr:hypothetical protein [Burkholderiales bacterium]
FVDAPTDIPRFIITAYQATLGYELSRNVQISAGWQFYNYERNVGTFYNGNRWINMDGGFVTLGVTL